MKSITIKGSERESVGKVAKALRNAGGSLRVIRRRSVHFQQKKKAFKTWFTQTLTQL
jgi:large subunit ribosomal protein L25